MCMSKATMLHMKSLYTVAIPCVPPLDEKLSLNFLCHIGSPHWATLLHFVWIACTMASEWTKHLSHSPSMMPLPSAFIQLITTNANGSSSFTLKMKFHQTHPQPKWYQSFRASTAPRWRIPNKPEWTMVRHTLWVILTVVIIVVVPALGFPPNSMVHFPHIPHWACRSSQASYGRASWQLWNQFHAFQWLYLELTGVSFGRPDECWAWATTFKGKAWGTASEPHRDQTLRMEP